MQQSMQPITFATWNPTKLAEAKALFAGTGWDIRSAAEAGIADASPEDHPTIFENAGQKALYVHRQVGGAVIADDTELCILALGGKPGVHTARWGGPGLGWRDRTRHCLNEMSETQDRTAIFRTAVAVMLPEGGRYFFFGEVEGRILRAPQCEPKERMPYSPLFVPVGDTRSWAAMTNEEENATSHRGKAFRQVIDFLRSRQ